MIGDINDSYDDSRARQDERGQGGGRGEEGDAQRGRKIETRQSIWCESVINSTAAEFSRLETLYIVLVKMQLLFIKRGIKCREHLFIFRELRLVGRIESECHE